MADAVLSGVFPCYENQFQIGTGTDGKTMSDIADMETFGVSFDDGVEEWNPFDAKGWTRRLKTSKSITISVSGKRNVGDTGNDKVSSLIFKNGKEAEAPFQWTFPDGTVVKFDNAVINVKNNGGGDATNVGPLEFDVMSNGKPTVTPVA